jgi:type II restriction enzyme
MTKNAFERIKSLNEQLHQLSPSQLSWVESIVDQFSVKRAYFKSDLGLIDECILESFGDALLIHHCISKEPFSKDKFEYVLERTFNSCGQSAEIAPKALIFSRIFVL